MMECWHLIRYSEEVMDTSLCELQIALMPASRFSNSWAGVLDLLDLLWHSKPRLGKLSNIAIYRYTLSLEL